MLVSSAKGEVSLNVAKCHIFGTQNWYVWNQSITKKVKAIKEAPSPTCVSELKAYLGLISYYGKFLANLSIYCSCSLKQVVEKGREMEIES